MSITFIVSGGPTEDRRPDPEEPDYVETVHLLGELNLSNANAGLVIRALGLPPDDHGEIAGADLDVFIRRANLISNGKGAVEVRADHFAPGTLRAEGGEGNVKRLTKGASTWFIGCDDAGVRSRVAALCTLLVNARSHGLAVVWF